MHVLKKLSNHTVDEDGSSEDDQSESSSDEEDRDQCEYSGFSFQEEAKVR